MNYALVPNFSTALPSPTTTKSIPFHADPILTAIDRHDEAWSVFQVAADGEPSIQAEEGCDAARTALLSTACASRPGAFALLRHLRWWLDEEAVNSEAYGGEWAIAQAREADLTLLLGCDGVRRIPVTLPSGRLVSVPVQPVAPAPLMIEASPSLARSVSRIPLVSAAMGELMAALVLIGGGSVLTGLAILI